MKRRINFNYIIVVLVVLIGIKFIVNEIYTDSISIDKIRYLAYMNSIPDLDEEGLEQAALAIESESIISDQIIYFGRSSCPYCVESVEKIKNIFQKYESIQKENGEESIKKFYFNTDKHDTDKITKLRHEIGVDYIPSIVIIDDGQMIVFSPEEIAMDSYMDEFVTKMESLSLT